MCLAVHGGGFLAFLELIEKEGGDWWSQGHAHIVGEQGDGNKCLRLCIFADLYIAVTLHAFS